MIIEKITLKVGKKKIELTADEYAELKQHFAELPDQYTPVVFPASPMWPYGLWYGEGIGPYEESSRRVITGNITTTGYTVTC